jgi:hypothetical protein
MFKLAKEIQRLERNILWPGRDVKTYQDGRARSAILSENKPLAESSQREKAEDASSSLFRIQQDEWDDDEEDDDEDDDEIILLDFDLFDGDSEVQNGRRLRTSIRELQRTRAPRERRPRGRMGTGSKKDPGKGKGKGKGKGAPGSKKSKKKSGKKGKGKGGNSMPSAPFTPTVPLPPSAPTAPTAPTIPSPTKAPTNRPTPPPSPRPSTSNPDETPTPTETPVELPTVEPGRPTNEPTPQPTPELSPEPTPEPTDQPVAVASSAPSEGGTAFPTPTGPFERCFINDSPNIGCPPPDLARLCDKYNDGTFDECFNACIDAFCCIHDSQAERSLSCSGETNCRFFDPCYIVWWKLHDTIGPAPYLRLEQNEPFYEGLTTEDFIQVFVDRPDFFDQFFGHHFLTDDLPLTDETFTDPNNW